MTPLALQQRLLKDEDPEDTIYYLMTAIPHLNDRSIFGPFHVREAFVPSLLSKVRQTDPRAVPIVQQMLDEVELKAFRFHTVNIPGAGDHKLEIWLHKERNAAVRAALPCPTWKILYTGMAGAHPTESRATPGAAQVADLQIKATFLSQEAAEAAGMGVATRILGPDVRERELGEGNGKAWFKDRDFTKVVTIGYDSGETVQ